MTTSDMIRKLCEKQGISLAALCRRLGQTPQNFNKKLKIADCRRLLILSPKMPKSLILCGFAEF